MSGGQQQRLALARSLVMEPKVLLLDEPLSNLDARLRLEMRNELQRVQKDTGITMVFVTHDQSEALALGGPDRSDEGRTDRAAWHAGGTLYAEPRTAFAADFMGFENIFRVEGGALVSERGPSAAWFRCAEDRFLAWRPGGVVVGEGHHTGRIIASSFAGQHRNYVLECALGQIKADMCRSTTPEVSPSVRRSRSTFQEQPRDRLPRDRKFEKDARAWPEDSDLNAPELRSRAVKAAQGLAPFDLLITNGRLLDMVTGRVRDADIGIVGGLIASVHAPDPTREARTRLDADHRHVVPA